VFEFVAVRAEGVGFEDVCAGGLVEAVDFADVVGPGDAPEFRAFAGLEAAFVEEGTHRAVKNQRRGKGMEVQGRKRWHRVNVVRGI
jgi:hypothetical protein